DIDLSNYEANQHFFLGQYFRENYNTALSMLPIISSPINIKQIEVWISNRANAYEDARDIMALMDLGEYNPHNTIINQGSSRLPATGIPGELALQVSNDYRTQLGDMGRVSNLNFVQSFFASTGGSDNYAKLTDARRLVEDRDIAVNGRLGCITLMY